MRYDTLNYLRGRVTFDDKFAFTEWSKAVLAVRPILRPALYEDRPVDVDRFVVRIVFVLVLVVVPAFVDTGAAFQFECLREGPLQQLGPPPEQVEVADLNLKIPKGKMWWPLALGSGIVLLGAWWLIPRRSDRG